MDKAGERTCLIHIQSILEMTPLKMKIKKRTNLSLLAFILPAFLVFAVFKLWPSIAGFYYGMTDWNGINQTFNFVGLKNYFEVFSDGYFWSSMWFTFKYVIVMVLVANVIALALSALIESRKRAKGLYRTIFYMPNMISLVIGGYMWMFIFTKVLYYIADNTALKFLDQSWIGNPNLAFIAIIIVSVWGAVGYLMIIYMAAIQGIPTSLTEAAHLDGASPIKTFFKVSLPLIQHAITICVFWTLNTAFQVFDVIYTLTGGGPGRATQSVAINIYQEAFRGNFRYGYASAKSALLFVIVLIITVIQVKLMKQKELEL